MITLSAEEAAELYRFLFRAYLNPASHPALMGLIARLEAAQ
jgi:hypothetical protein